MMVIDLRDGLTPWDGGPGKIRGSPSVVGYQAAFLGLMESEIDFSRSESFRRLVSSSAVVDAPIPVLWPHDSAEAILLLGAFVVIFAVTAGLVFIVRFAYKRIEQLEQC